MLETLTGPRVGICKLRTGAIVEGALVAETRQLFYIQRDSDPAGVPTAFPKATNTGETLWALDGAVN